MCDFCSESGTWWDGSWSVSVAIVEVVVGGDGSMCRTTGTVLFDSCDVACCYGLSVVSLVVADEIRCTIIIMPESSGCTSAGYVLSENAVGFAGTV